MLRLLFLSAAILPVAIVPFLTHEADTIEDAAVEEASYAQVVREPSLEALADCETEDVPVFFSDEDVSRHSERFIADSLDTAQTCGTDVSVVIIPVLPSGADHAARAESVERTAELQEVVRQNGLRARIAPAPRDAAAESLYLSGRAAILRIEPEGETRMAAAAGDSAP